MKNTKNINLKVHIYRGHEIKPTEHLYSNGYTWWIGYTEVAAKQFKTLAQARKWVDELIEFQIQEMKRVEALRLSASTANRLGNTPAKFVGMPKNKGENK